ncbi:MAG: ABC transporter ATP-binding protein [Beijerinckiaceae bacterium]
MPEPQKTAGAEDPGAALIEIENLSVRFETARGSLPAVDGVSLSLREGETLGLVGESACGKSTTCQAILRLSPLNATLSGRIMFGGRDLLTLPDAELCAIRGRDISMIFQDPIASLNPVHRVGAQIGEVLRLHQGMSASGATAEVRRLLDIVGIPDPGRRMAEYPHQLSGGMNQRAGIAMALASRPKLLIADEPTTALDVTIQAQILDLLRSLQKEYGMALILVTHDLGVVAEMASRVAVMYAGRIVEDAPVEALFGSPQHPYTRGLLASIPSMDSQAAARLPVIEGNVPSLDVLPTGCGFAPRCGFTADICKKSKPPLAPAGRDHLSACLRTADLARGVAA